jgi:peptidoglycan/LPS O-acetylase OafA/YrhL
MCGVGILTATVCASLRTQPQFKTLVSFLKKHMSSLDGLRGIAILLVLFTHLLPYRPAHSALMRLFNGIAGCGWAGVNIFFVLSGFLITGILYDSKGTAFFFRNFYMRRTLRIVPLYVLLVVCCLYVFPHWTATQGSLPAAHHWMYWVYLSNLPIAFFGDVRWGWLGPLWTLAVEEHFYLVWPAVIAACSRKSAMRVCLGCAVLAYLTRLWFVTHGNLLGPYVFTFSRVDDLAAGAFAALLIRDNPDHLRVQTLARRVLLISSVPVAFIFVWKHAVISDPATLTAGFTFIGAFSASALLLAVLPGASSIWKRFLNIGVLKQFGKYSYGLYMLHVPVAGVMHQQHLLLASTSRRTDLMNLVLQLAVSFLVAVTSYHLFEKHFLRLKRFFGPEPKPELPVLFPAVERDYVNNSQLSQVGW